MVQGLIIVDLRDAMRSAFHPLLHTYFLENITYQFKCIIVYSIVFKYVQKLIKNNGEFTEKMTTLNVLSLYCIKFCSVAINCVVPGHPILNTCWSMVSKVFFTECPKMCLNIMCSMTLQHIHINDIGP